MSLVKTGITAWP